VTPTTPTEPVAPAEPESLVAGAPEIEPVDPVAPVEPAVPLTAEDISIPEGLQIPDEIRDDFLGIVNDGEMSPKDQAQALIELQARAAEQASNETSQQFLDQQQQWQDEVKGDAEIGGANFQATLGGIQRLVDQYGNDEFIGVMASTGAGNNVHVVKFFNAIAQKLNEGGPVSGAPANASESAASRMFPSMKG